MAFLDSSRDLYLLGLPSGAGKLKQPIKIGKWLMLVARLLTSLSLHGNDTLLFLSLSLSLSFSLFLSSAASSVGSFEWSSDCSMLAYVRDEELCVLPYPPAVPNDPSLLDKFVMRRNIRRVHKTKRNQEIGPSIYRAE